MSKIKRLSYDKAAGMKPQPKGSYCLYSDVQASWAKLSKLKTSHVAQIKSLESKLLERYGDINHLRNSLQECLEWVGIGCDSGTPRAAKINNVITKARSVLNATGRKNGKD